MRWTLFLICWSLLLVPSWAWNDPGHRVVALISEHKLPEPVRAWIVQTLAFHPDPQVRSLSTAAPWPDQVRRKPKYHHSAWHYQNIPIFLDGNKRKVIDKGKALSALNLQTRILKNPGSKPEAKAIALSWIVHIIGDIHQPLHAVNGFSQAFPAPEGDRGGNKIQVSLDGKSINLHAFWDSCGESLLKKDRANSLESIAADLMASPAQLQLVEQPNPKEWIAESVKLAKESVYGGLPANGVLTPGYIKRARQVGRSRITLAGLRLAEYLQRIYTSTSKS